MDLSGLPPWQHKRVEELISKMNLPRDNLSAWQQKVLTWVDEDKGALLWVNVMGLDPTPLADFIASTSAATVILSADIDIDIDTMIEIIAAKHAKEILRETVCILCVSARDTYQPESVLAPAMQLISQLTTGDLKFVIKRRGARLVTNLPIGPRRVIVLTTVGAPTIWPEGVLTHFECLSHRTDEGDGTGVFISSYETRAHA